MKKLFLVLAIFAALASQPLVSKADGDVHNPGFYCPDPLVCCMEPPPPGVPPVQCPDDGGSNSSSAESKDGNSQEDPGDYLLSLLGF